MFGFFYQKLHSAWFLLCILVEFVRYYLNKRTKEAEDPKHSKIDLKKFFQKNCNRESDGPSKRLHPRNSCKISYWNSSIKDGEIMKKPHGPV